MRINLKIFPGLVLLVIFVFVLACKNKSKGHLPPDVMQRVLMDITMAEGYSTMVKDTLHKGGTKNHDSLATYYKDILGHYKITQEQFDESMEWYKDNATELDSIYTYMAPVISRLQTKYSKTPNP